MSHCLVTMHRGLYMAVSRAIDVQVDMDKDQTSEQEIKFLRDWIEKQMRTHLLFSDLGPDSLINSFIHSFILAWLFKTLLLRRAHIALYLPKKKEDTSPTHTLLIS